MDPGFRRGDVGHLGRADGAFRLPTRSSFRRKPESIQPKAFKKITPRLRLFILARGFCFLIRNKQGDLEMKPKFANFLGRLAGAALMLAALAWPGPA